MTGLLTGGGLLVGADQLMEEGNRYQRQMNLFQAVSRQMVHQGPRRMRSRSRRRLYELIR